MNNSPVIAEIVGPSGAGKSTLSSTINAANAGVKAGLTVWRMPTTDLALSGIRSLPDLISLGVERKQFRKEELKQIIRLDAFYRSLKRRGEGENDSALLLDEGVVFALAKLRADFGAEFVGDRMRRWEQRVLNRWSSMLRAIVWLDAPDDVLIQRIRSRAKHHRMKDKDDWTTREFLRKYRAAYTTVIGELAVRGDVRILSFQTDVLDPKAMAAEIVELCGRIGKKADRAGERSSGVLEVKSGQPIQTGMASR